MSSIEKKKKPKAYTQNRICVALQELITDPNDWSIQSGHSLSVQVDVWIANAMQTVLITLARTHFSEAASASA